MTNPEHRDRRLLSGDDALELLKEGNRRFVRNLKINRSLHDQVIETQFEQHPVAAVVSCMDSHVSPELLFDLGLGDIYAIRTAGNAVSAEVADSLDYAVQSGVPLILVLGHTNCKAIELATDEGGKSVRLLAQLLRPAIKQQQSFRLLLTGQEFINGVACLHVQHSLNGLVQKGSLIKKRLLSGELMLAGGMYDVATGLVKFYPYNIEQEQTPPALQMQRSIVSELLVK